MIVLYHRGCVDGFCAAWCFWHRYYKENATLEFVSVNYGEDVPKKALGHAMIMIVDFSYKKEVIKGLVEDGHYVAVLDHHKTAQEELFGLIEAIGREEDWIYKDWIYCDDKDKFPINEGKLVGKIGDYPVVREKLLDIRFNLEKSGARLAWEYCYSNEDNKAAPRLVDYVEDRDLWRWKLPGSHAINAAISSFPFDFEIWENQLYKGLQDSNNDLFKMGEGILQYKERLLERIVKNARRKEIGGYKVPVVNSCVLQSELGNILCVGEPFAAIEYVDNEGRLQVSLRSDNKNNDSVDVSNIAKLFGGGGHHNAAGYSKMIN